MVSIDRTPVTVFKSEILPRFLVLALVVPFAIPFLSGRFPVSDDGLLAVIRLVGLDNALRHGQPWPLITPALNLGYGSPIFAYSGPLSLYPAVIFHQLGMTYTNAVLAATVFWAAVAALGAYHLSRALAGQAAGMIAGPAFIYSALLGYWGNTAQLAAIALIPWLFSAFLALSRARNPFRLMLAVVAFGAVVISHNITAMIAAGLLTAFIVALVIITRQRQTALWLGSAFLLGLLVSAFLWLPALAETEAVHIERLASFNFREHFLPPLYAFTVYPPAEYSLHWPQLVLAITAVVAAFAPARYVHDKRALSRGWSAFFALITIGLVFLTTSYSSFIWETVPLMYRIEFPKRLLLSATLSLAVLAGAGAQVVTNLLKGRRVWGWVALCLVSIIAYSIPQLRIPVLDPQPTVLSILDMHDLERNTGWYGGTSAAEYVPASVADRLHSWTFTDRYAVAEVIPRLAQGMSVDVTEQAWGLTSADLLVSADQPTSLIFEWSHMPGWVAVIDDTETPVVPVEPYGFMSVSVPTGEHAVSIRYRGTQLRRTAGGISAATFLLVAAFALFWQRIRPVQSSTRV